VCLTRSWATATSGGSLLEGSRTLARGPTLARQPELVGDRIGTSLAPQISEALEAEASVGETEVFPKRLTDRSPQPAGAKPDPEAGPRHFICRTQAQRSVCALPVLPKEQLTDARTRKPGYRRLLPETPSEDSARLHNRSPRQAREPPARGGGLREAGDHPGGPRAPACGGQVASEEARCVQDLLDTGRAARERAVEREFRRIGAPEASHATAIRCACKISAKTWVDCLKVEP